MTNKKDPIPEDISIFINKINRIKDHEKKLDFLRDTIKVEGGINEHNWDKIRKGFTSIWTLERVKGMKLEEYTDTNREYSFTYWIENELKGLGDIHGATSLKFGIYKLNSKKPKNYKGDAEYAWRGDLGEDHNSVFKKMKQNIEHIIEYIREGDLEKIDHMGGVSPMFKWKISFLYSEKNNIVPIYSYQKLEKILGEKGLTYPEIYTKLLSTNFGNNNNFLETSWKLWGKIKKIQVKESIYKISQSARNNAVSLYIENCQGKTLFAWDKKPFFANLQQDDIVYFLNKYADTKKEFKLIKTKVYKNTGVQLCKHEDEIFLDIKGGSKIPIVEFGNDLKKYVDTEFMLFLVEESIFTDFNTEKFKTKGQSTFSYLNKDAKDYTEIKSYLVSALKSGNNSAIGKNPHINAFQEITHITHKKSKFQEFDTARLIESGSILDSKLDKKEKADYLSHRDYTSESQLKSDIGLLGEELVLKHEGVKARHASKVQGDGLGYDIVSVDKNNNIKYIEVKSTRDKTAKNIYISSNELRKLKSLKNAYIYIVSNMQDNQEPLIEYIQITDTQGKVMISLDNYVVPYQYQIFIK